MEHLIKPKAIFIDNTKSLYRIEEIFPDLRSVSYSFKNNEQSDYKYEGLTCMDIMIHLLETRQLLPIGFNDKTIRVLYG